MLSADNRHSVDPEPVASRGNGCPWCGYGNAVAGITGTRHPEAGDAALCSNCGGVALYVDDDGGRRRATPEETTAILGRPEVRDVKGRMQDFVAEMNLKQIHVGVGTPAVCAACGELWPCSGATPGQTEKARGYQGPERSPRDP